jgi:Na+/H+-dicarboxylate symporter
MSIVPENIVSAFADLNMLAVLFTSIVFGVAIVVLRAGSGDFKAPAEALYQGIAGLEAATLRIMSWVLEVLPFGILAIVAHTISTQGVDALLSLAAMVGALYLGLAGQLLFYTLLLAAFGVGLRRFFASARTPMVTAFATQSSSGTLPVTMAAADRLGLSRSIHGVALPLGATINLDGAALRIAVSAVFAANVVGVSLGWGQLAEIVVVGTLISIGTAGVPGAGIVMIATVFYQVGLPIETVVLSSIDALVDMGATEINVTGDLVGVALIDRIRFGRKDDAQPPACALPTSDCG